MPNIDETVAEQLVRDEVTKLGYVTIRELLEEGSRREIRKVMVAGGSAAR